MQRKIVIVDDDYGIQDIARLIFERAGFSTIVMDSPQPLYNYEHTDTNIILLDRQLCGLDGLQVCRELKMQPQYARIPILLMSATSAVPLNLQEAMADGFVEKPFRKKELLEKIDSILLM